MYAAPRLVWVSARMAWAGVRSGVGWSGSGKVGLTSAGVCSIEASKAEMAPGRSRSWYLRAAERAMISHEARVLLEMQLNALHDSEVVVACGKRDEFAVILHEQSEYKTHRCWSF